MADENVMADENDAGASYLAALRKSTSSAATGAAAARTPLPEPASAAAPASSAPASNSPDKRRSPRYKCSGSARIQEVGAAVSSWATLADISMHGCYVETSAPLRMGAALTLKLEANDLRIEAAGEVRVVYPGLAMGISFSHISTDNRERLRELLRPIARPSVLVTSSSPGSRDAARSAFPPPSHSGAPSGLANPAAALQAIHKFFEDRHVIGREEFLRILRISQS